MIVDDVFMLTFATYFSSMINQRHLDLPDSQIAVCKLTLMIFAVFLNEPSDASQIERIHKQNNSSA